jgi:hypothetical protein
MFTQQYCLQCVTRFYATLHIIVFESEIWNNDALNYDEQLMINKYKTSLIKRYRLRQPFDLNNLIQFSVLVSVL